MKKLLVLAGLLAPLSAFASEAVVKDYNKVIIKQEPYSIEVCRDVEVAYDVERKGSDSGKLGRFILGAAIGSAVGNQVSDGHGAGAIGGLLGGAIAAEEGGSTERRYRTEQRCSNETRYNEVQHEVYSHSTVTFMDNNGVQRTLRFSR